MSELVFLEPNKIDAEPFTTSDVVAEAAGVGYRSTQRLIESQKARLEKFGRVRFEITPSETKGGVQDRKIYRLNEPQATLLITFMKNTDRVADFKVELVRQFYAMRAELTRRHAERAALKPIRREMTDVIKQVDDSPWAHKKYTDLAYKVTIGKVAKKIREERGATKKDAAVDYMSADEIHSVTDAQYKIAVLLELGMDYTAVKSALANRVTLKQA